MRRFNAPPGWPSPPNVRWRPPKGWQPHESWPQAPPGWSFWIDEDGKRVTGPLGRYGGLGRAWLISAGCLAALLLLGSCQLFGGEDPTPVSGSAPGAPSGEASVGPDGVATSDSTTIAPQASTGTPSPGATLSPAAVPTSTPTLTTAGPPGATQPPARSESAGPGAGGPTGEPSASVSYKNCGAVRAAGKAPLLRGQPGYSADLDPDGDGVACARGG